MVNTPVGDVEARNCRSPVEMTSPALSIPPPAELMTRPVRVVVVVAMERLTSPSDPSSGTRRLSVRYPSRVACTVYVAGTASCGRL